MLCGLLVALLSDIVIEHEYVPNCAFEIAVTVTLALPPAAMVPLIGERPQFAGEVLDEVQVNVAVPELVIVKVFVAAGT
jgi:hypothetical protein